MAAIRRSPTAATKLQQIEEFIACDSVLHAVNFTDRLVESTETLRFSPKSSRITPEFNREDLGAVLFRGYREVYLLASDTTTMFRVAHGARDLADLVRREP